MSTLHILVDLLGKIIDTSTVSCAAQIAYAYDLRPIEMNLPFIIVGLTIHIQGLTYANRLSDKWGLRTIHIYSTIPCIVLAWLCLGLKSSIWVLLIC